MEMKKCTTQWADHLCSLFGQKILKQSYFLLGLPEFALNCRGLESALILAEEAGQSRKFDEGSG
jgi:hypothetical protein